MLRIDAASAATPMIKFHSGRDRSNESCMAPTMCDVHPAAVVEEAVTIASASAGPQDTV